jgi:hypothetical protein
MDEAEAQQEGTKSAAEPNRDAWRLSSRERWFFALPSFAWVVLSAGYPMLVDRFLGPVLAHTSWRDLPRATQKTLALAHFIEWHYWKFGAVALVLVWVYFRWVSRNRANVYIFDFVLVIWIGTVLWRTYQGLNAAGVL